jgi:hypothetical protein
MKRSANNKKQSTRRVRRNNEFSSYIQRENMIYRVRLSFTTVLSTTGGGSILTSIALNPSLASEFSAFQAIYDEYRIMGGVVILTTTPPIQTSGSSPESGQIYLAYDFNDTTAPSTVADVITLGTRSQFQAISADRLPFKYHFRTPLAGNGTAINWIPVASATNTGSIKFAAQNLTASRDYTDVLVDLYVQFRGRV